MNVHELRNINDCELRRTSWHDPLSFAWYNLSIQYCGLYLYYPLRGGPTFFYHLKMEHERLVKKFNNELHCV